MLKKAVLKLAGLFSPVGAVVQLVLTLWDVFQALREQFSRLMGVVTSVVEALGEIVAGRIDPAKQKIEDVLAALIPVAIGLFARLVWLGGLGRKVQEFIEAIRGRIERAVRRLILKIKARVQRMMRRRRSRNEHTPQNARPEDAHQETSPEDERTHRRFAGEAKAALEEPPEPSDDAIDFAALLRQKRAEADRLEQHYDRRLENPVRMTIAIDQSQAVRERQIIPFEVRVAPNDTQSSGQIPFLHPLDKPEERLNLFRSESAFAIRSVNPEVFQHPTHNEKYKRTSFKPWNKQSYVDFIEPRAHSGFSLTASMWRNDQQQGLRRSGWFHIGSAQSQRYGFAEDAASGLGWLRFIGHRDRASDDEKIAVYKLILSGSKVSATQWPADTLSADDYRRTMRAQIVQAYQGRNKLADLDEQIIHTPVPSAYNRVIGGIFEDWVAANYGVRRDPVPVFKSSGLDRAVIPDGFDGTTLVEIKAISEVRAPSQGEVSQMKRYERILNKPIGWLNLTGDKTQKLYYDRIRYHFNSKEVAEAWLTTIKREINSTAKQIGMWVIAEKR